VHDGKGLTPLMYAADNQHIETMQLLLANGAEVNAKDAKARTAIMRAAIEGHAEVIRILRANGAVVNARDAGKTGDSTTVTGQQSAPNGVAPQAQDR